MPCVSPAASDPVSAPASDPVSASVSAPVSAAGSSCAAGTSIFIASNVPLITSSATPSPLITLYTSALSVGEPAFFQAVLSFSAVTFVVTCFAAPLIAPPTALAPVLRAPPTLLAAPLIASNGPSFKFCL